jgi:hypothetical protein
MKSFVALTIAAMFVAPASAATIAINGGNSWGGWQFIGDSTTDGVWAAGFTDRPYDIYRTEFTLDANQTVTGTRLVNTATVGDGSSFTGNEAADLFTGDWRASDSIVGFGAQYAAGFSVQRFFIGLDFDRNNFKSASFVGAGDGIAAGETAGDVSIFQTASRRWITNSYAVFSGPDTSVQAFATNDAMPVRVYVIPGTTNLDAISYQFLYNISAAIRAGNAGGVFSRATSVRILEKPRNNNDSQQVLEGALPEPANWAMMIVGFGLVGAIQRRGRRLSPSAVAA